MAMRFAASRASMCGSMAGSSRRTPRYFSDGKGGRVLNEEERALESIYIKKMEREKLEKKNLQEEKDKAAAKEPAEKKTGEETR